ncbi:MAG: hypothetical protein KAK04_10290 [Cyclobacteriaceae bacterium]|nr:hypothetical protein [Cyclobacteriaceae bacterium]
MEHIPRLLRPDRALSPNIYGGTSFGKFLGDKSAFTAVANLKEGELLKGVESVLT